MSGGTFGNQAYNYYDLPFPPQRVYCVYVERGPTGGPTSRQVLFVTLHRDLYHADWIVHEGDREPFSGQYAQALSDLGCAPPARP